MRQYVCLSEQDCDALFERLQHRLRLDERGREAGRERERLTQEQKQVQRLIAQLYEDRAAGKIGDTNFYPLLEQYEHKTAVLQQQVDALPSADGDKALRRQQERLRSIIRQYTDVAALTPSLLLELIEQIEVGQGTYEKVGKGRVKRQKIVIYFRFLPEPYETDWTQ